MDGAVFLAGLAKWASNSLDKLKGPRAEAEATVSHRKEIALCCPIFFTTTLLSFAHRNLDLLKQTKALVGKSCRLAAYDGWCHHLHEMRCTDLTSPQCHQLTKSRGSSSLTMHRCLVFSNFAHLHVFLSNQPLPWMRLGKSSWLQSPLNFTSWKNSLPFRYPKHTHGSCPLFTPQNAIENTFLVKTFYL